MIDTPEDFLRWLKTPVNFTSEEDWSDDENKKILKYQELCRELFLDLKKDGYVLFSDIFSIDKNYMEKIQNVDDETVEFVRFITNLSNKVKESKELDAEEQWYILLNLYLSVCEQIKNFFEDYIEDIYKGLKDKSNLSCNKFLTMWPFKEIMSRYKEGKYCDLFDPINVKLRNSIAHVDFRFKEDDNNIYYNDTYIEALDFLKTYRMASVLFSILFVVRIKTFANEFEMLAKERKLI
jgi:hypothetical protein